VQLKSSSSTTVVASAIFSLLSLGAIASCARPSNSPPPTSPSSVVSAAETAPAGLGKPTHPAQRMVYDLLTNRVHAILHLGGRMVISAGSVDLQSAPSICWGDLQLERFGNSSGKYCSANFTQAGQQLVN